MYKKLLVLVLVLGLSSSAVAAVLEVGSGETYATIIDAYAACSSGDTINVHTGTYAALDMWGSDGKNNITFQRNGTDKVILNSTWYIRYNDGITLDGFVWYQVPGDHGIYLRNSGSDFVEDFTLKNSILFDNDKTGIYVYSDTDSGNGHANIVIENNTFYQNADWGNIALYRHCPNPTVKDNITVYAGDGVINGEGYGVIANNASSAVSVEYTCFYGNEEGPVGLNATVGTGSLTTTQPIFSSTNLNDADFMWLDETCSDLIVLGASDGGYMGARPQIPEPATIALLGFGGLLLRRRKK